MRRKISEKAQRLIRTRYVPIVLRHIKENRLLPFASRTFPLHTRVPLFDDPQFNVKGKFANVDKIIDIEIHYFMTHSHSFYPKSTVRDKVLFICAFVISDLCAPGTDLDRIRDIIDDLLPEKI